LTGVASGDDITTDKAKLNYHIIDVYPTEDDIMNPNTSIGMQYQELKLKMDHFYTIQCDREWIVSTIRIDY
jgi:hypothetical protein